MQIHIHFPVRKTVAMYGFGGRRQKYLELFYMPLYVSPTRQRGTCNLGKTRKGTANSNPLDHAAARVIRARNVIRERKEKEKKTANTSCCQGDSASSSIASLKIAAISSKCARSASCTGELCQRSFTCGLAPCAFRVMCRNHGGKL